MFKVTKFTGIPGQVCFDLQWGDEPEKYGELLVAKTLTGHKNWVVESSLDEPLRGNYLGMLLYETALLKMKYISTTYENISDEAKRVWDSLTRKYDWYFAENGDLVVTKDLIKNDDEKTTE